MIGGAAFGRFGVALHIAHGEAAELVNAAHEFGIAFCEVVVDGDDVAAAAAPAGDGGGEGGGEGFAFAGGHFSDAAVEHGEGAGDLDEVVFFAASAGGDFADEGDGFEQIERCVLAGTKHGAIVERHFPQAGVGDVFVERGEREDALGAGEVAAGAEFEAGEVAFGAVPHGIHILRERFGANLGGEHLPGGGGDDGGGHDRFGAGGEDGGVEAHAEDSVSDISRPEFTL